MLAMSRKVREGVLELRTDAGPVYVSPTLWERIYLLWTFRNFHTLPKQVLNRQQQQLIEKLCRAPAIVHNGPISKTSIIGAVENLRALKGKLESAANPNKLIEISTSRARGAVPRAVGAERIPIPSSRVVYNRPDAEYVKRAADNVKHISAPKPDPASKSESKWRRPAWKGERTRFSAKLYWALIALSGIALLGILLPLREGRPAMPRVSIRQANLPRSSSATPPAQPEKLSVLAERQEVAPSIPRGVPAPVGSSKQNKVKQGTTASLSRPPAETTGPSVAERLQVAEAPESGFRYPAALSPTLAGTVKLKALIGRDGSVTQVEVLSGNPGLARAAVPAVRHWRYRAHTVNGHAVEAETNIVISFLGEDAVSVSFPAAP